MTAPTDTKPGATARKVTVHGIEPGRQHPLGATPDATGVNFSLFSRNATGVELLLFDDHDDPEPVEVIQLDPRVHKTFFFWHVYVRGLKPGVHYAYRVDGPWAPEEGHRFNRNKVIIDPYAKGLTTHLWSRGDSCGPDDNLATSMRGSVIDLEDYDWEGDHPLNRPMSETIVYEMHVGGFTKSPTSGVKNPGTFDGIVEKIPYLRELGVTAVELLPVFQFDESEIDKPDPTNPERRLTNFWGYSTVGFFAPHHQFCLAPEEAGHIRDFRNMVKALHKDGIEIILDVVFNHTSEGNHQGPTISFKGLDNSIFYHLVPWDREYYMDYSGCGNTVNCNHPVVEKFIVECLEFWVEEMHVDGFRFDEGSILSRGEDGAPMVHPPVTWNIELSEALSDTKIIAEAWDAAGLYQIGYFPGYRWAEWNGKYRDDIRNFVRGEAGLVGAVAARISGSADLYQATGHLPMNSVNFVNCHDGFTLNDLVSYNGKHNEANGENNNDGVNDNDSWNCGWEGPSTDPGVEALREQQIRNFATILMVSQGVPMFVAGDEVRRTQNGNNNGYCQNNELSWFDWTQAEQHQDLYRYFKEIIAFRKAHPALHRPRFFSGEMNERGVRDIDWHSCRLYQPGWTDGNARALAFTLAGLDGDPDIHVMMNMHWEGLSFELPTVQGRQWYVKADTARPSPADIVVEGQEHEVVEHDYGVGPRSVVVLISK